MKRKPTTGAMILGLAKDVECLSKSMLVIARRIKRIEKEAYGSRIIRGFCDVESGREVPSFEDVEDIGEII